MKMCVTICLEQPLTRDDLHSHTVHELKELARQRGIDISGVLEKTELVEKLLSGIR